MEEPLLVEVIAYAPTAYYHCMHCEVGWREMGVSNHLHQEQLTSSLPPDLIQDYQKVSDWVREITHHYCDKVMIKVIDAASLEGFIKSLRYRVRKFPAVVVNHQARFPQGEFDQAREEIDRQVSLRGSITAL